MNSLLGRIGNIPLCKSSNIQNKSNQNITFVLLLLRKGGVSSEAEPGSLQPWVGNYFNYVYVNLANSTLRMSALFGLYHRTFREQFRESILR